MTEFLPAGSVEALGDGDYRVMFLAHGTTKTGQPPRYYPKRVLEQAAGAAIFDGAKMYLNHVKPGRDVPHRDLRDWAATIKPGSVRCVEGNLEAVCHAHLPEARAILDDPIAKLSVGLSHDSNIRVSKGRVDGAEVHVVEAISKCHSVDFVPDGNAHGRVIEATQEEEIDMAELTAEQMEEITKRVAEAVAEPVANAVVAKMAETAKAADEAAKAEDEKRQQEAADAEKPEADRKLIEELRALREAKVSEDQRVAEATARIKALEDERAAGKTLEIITGMVQARDDLSPVSQRRVIEGFAGQIIAPDQIGTRVQEACDRERTYALELLQAAGVRTKVTGTGATDSGRTQEAVKAYEDEFAARARAMGIDEKTLKAMQELPR
ncbi:hypothetical protein [Candidatus Neomicrothrix sp.]|uniref:hypothetical protein n=1 Tax=Candidatus Neomicrothrix sp. TaxID=2719034 RepID=UPI001B5888E3|nr:hypothetical protein [Candidatus Microthrix sp.]MBP7989050.1 hypothetical protein [Candidatus Microthrix sp.]